MISNDIEDGQVGWHLRRDQSSFLSLGDNFVLQYGMANMAKHVDKVGRLLSLPAIESFGFAQKSDIIDIMGKV